MEECDEQRFFKVDGRRWRKSDPIRLRRKTATERQLENHMQC